MRARFTLSARAIVSRRFNLTLPGQAAGRSCFSPLLAIAQAMPGSFEELCMSYVGFMGTEEERFWSKVKILSNECWEWQGAISDGYGTFGLQRQPGTRRNQMVKAHIYSFLQNVGQVPEGTELDHTCRNRACVNPDHLEPVTHRENVLRGKGPCAVNAAKQFCKLGHPLSGDNLRIQKKKYRLCRICDNANHTKNKLRKVKKP